MPIVAVDTETGGFDPRANALLSVSLVELDRDLNPTRSLDVFILPDPGKAVTTEAARINGYTPEKWAERGALPLSSAMRKIATWMPRQAEALAHNAGFDKAFLDDAEKATGVRTWLHPRWRCSMATFLAVNDALMLGAPDAKLDTLARMSGHWAAVHERGAHESLADALACAAGYRWLLGKIRAGATGESGKAATAAS